MASRNFSRVQALNHEVKIIAGIISITAAAGDSIAVKGDRNAKVKGLEAWIPQTAPTSSILSSTLPNLSLSNLVSS